MSKAPKTIADIKQAIEQTKTRIQLEQLQLEALENMLKKAQFYPTHPIPTEEQVKAPTKEGTPSNFNP